jgi:ABC-type transport system involved in cytochrome bd biosynthesis fused ATPase/permease subunit
MKTIFKKVLCTLLIVLGIWLGYFQVVVVISALWSLLGAALSIFGLMVATYLLCQIVMNPTIATNAINKVQHGLAKIPAKLRSYLAFNA